MITRLVLENWRSHENTEFDFNKGTNVLVGSMGSGKSSAMDAVSFALFGTFPSLQQRKVKLDDMIMNKPQHKTSARVLLSFRIDGKEYTVKREVTRGKGQTSAEILLDDKLLDAANQRVSERIEDILKINYDLFSRAVYAEQNNIDYFLEIPKGKRKEKIDELLKIDRFEAARKSLGTILSRLVDRIDDKNRLAAEQQDTGELEEVGNSLGADIREIERNEALLLGGKKAAEAAQSGYNEVLKKKGAFSEQDSKIKKARGRIEMLQSKLSEYHEIRFSEDGLKAEIAKKSEERKQVRGQIELIRRREAERDKLTALLDSHEKRLSEIDSRLQALGYEKEAPCKLQGRKEEIEEVRRELEEAIANHKSIGTKLAEIGESVEKLKEGREKCPTCDSDLDSGTVARLLGRRADERRKLTEECGVLAKKIDERGAHRRSLEKEIDALQKAVRNMEEAERENSEKGRVLKEAAMVKQNADIILKQLEGIKISRTEEDVEKEMKQLEEMLGYFNYNKELSKTADEITLLEKELGKLGYNEADERAAYDKFKEIEKDVAVYVQKCENLSALIAEKKKRLENLKKIRDEIEKSKREIEYLNKTIDSFQVLQRALQDVQGRLREEFTEETNIALTDVWKRLYPYADYLDLKLAIDESGDYIMKLQRRDNAWVNVEGVTSGGERSTACLALRIALSLVLTQNLSWLVLDEPTHNLDRKAVRELAVTLREHLPKIVDQVFVITHEEELESAASGSLYRLERNKEEDEPTRVVIDSSA